MFCAVAGASHADPNLRPGNFAATPFVRVERTDADGLSLWPG